MRIGIFVAVIGVACAVAGETAAWQGGGHMHLGTGLRVGTSHVALTDDGHVKKDHGTGLEQQLGLRIWYGPVLAGVVGVWSPGVFTGGETALLGGLGAKLELGKGMRLLALAEWGQHTFLGVRNLQGPWQNPNLPCFGLRVRLDRKGEDRIVSHGLVAFALLDAQVREVDTTMDGAVGVSFYDVDRRYRLGGILVGLAYEIALGP